MKLCVCVCVCGGGGGGGGGRQSSCCCVHGLIQADREQIMPFSLLVPRPRPAFQKSGESLVCFLT